MKTKFEVPIVYVGNLSYIVEADTKGMAEIIAREKFMNCEKGDIPSVEEEVITQIGEIQELVD